MDTVSGCARSSARHLVASAGGGGRSCPVASDAGLVKQSVAGPPAPPVHSKINDLLQRGTSEMPRQAVLLRLPVSPSSTSGEGRLRSAPSCIMGLRPLPTSILTSISAILWYKHYKLVATTQRIFPFSIYYLLFGYRLAISVFSQGFW